MIPAVRRALLPVVAAVLVVSGSGAVAAPAVAADGEWGVEQARPEPGSEPSADGQPATAAATAAAASSWVLRGSGWGHSLGMSQYGAQEMAKDGRSAAQILGHYYSGTTYDAVRDDRVLGVNVLHRVSSVTARSARIGSGGGGFTVADRDDTSRAMTGDTGSSVTMTRSGSDVVVRCSGCAGPTSITAGRVLVSWDVDDTTTMSYNGKTYRDGSTLVSTSTGSGLEVVNHVRVHDEYLDYLREVPWSWQPAALQAQAAAARGYALSKYRAGGRSSCRCHVYDSVYDQVYGTWSQASGDGTYWDRWRAAVRATGTGSTGYVARSGGSIIQAFYSSSSHGRTENNEDVWGGTPLSYIRGVDDPWSLRASNPRRDWRVTPSASSVASAFGLSDVARLDLSDRTANGGVRNAVATSSAGSTRSISGEQMRSRLGTLSIGVERLRTRYSGANRYAAAASLARSVQPGATSVVLAAGDSTLVDAAVAGPLAGTLSAPMLLTMHGGLPAATRAELDRRSGLRTAFVVGGEAVVSSRVVEALERRGLRVVRLAGANRYATSEVVAKEIVSRRSTTAVIVAGGEGLPDALGASGAANALRRPILLTPANRLAAATGRALDAVGARSAQIVGGTAVVGSRVENQLGARGVGTVRLSGADRYATSRAVADFYRSRVPTTEELVLTSGADANLVDSLVAGTRGRLIALTKPRSLASDAAATIQSTPQLERIVVVGGTAAVSSRVLQAAARA